MQRVDQQEGKLLFEEKEEDEEGLIVFNESITIYMYTNCIYYSTGATLQRKHQSINIEKKEGGVDKKENHRVLIFCKHL